MLHMLTTACPDCGLPVPVSLAFPDKISCPGCGFAGDIADETCERLKSAAQSIKSQDARLRQLTKRQRRNLESGWVFERVHSNLMGFTNYAVVNGEHYIINGLCLVEEARPAPAGEAGTNQTEQTE